VWLEVGDVEQAMVQLSQTMASLEHYPNCFFLAKLKAKYRVALIQTMRGETTQAFVALKELLGQVLEHGTEHL
jgi:hypothetical protein